LKKELFHVDAYEYSELLKSLAKKMENIKNIVKPDVLETRLSEIEEMQQDQDFWNDAANAGKISQEKTKAERILATYTNAYDAVNDASEYFELSKAENDEETLEMLYDDADEVEYVAIVDREFNALEEVVIGNTMILVAAWVGKPRLIDNLWI